MQQNALIVIMSFVLLIDIALHSFFNLVAIMLVVDCYGHGLIAQQEITYKLQQITYIDNCTGACICTIFSKS